MIRLALFATHPIQYHVPWFRALADHSAINLTVYYARLPDKEKQGEGFNESFEWDLPLLEGYDWRVHGAASAAAHQRHFGAIRSVVHPRRTDVVLVTGWQDAFLRRAALVSTAYQQPLIVRGESSGLKPRPWWVRMLHRAYLSLFDRFLVIGNSNQAFYQQYGIPEARLFRCPYFVENDRFDQQYQDLRPQRRELRQAFGIPPDATCVLFAGKFIEKKHPTDVLEALERLHDDRNVHGLMVGSGPLQEDLKQYARCHDLPVTFTGFLNQTEIAQAYTASDVLVLPSGYDETWGLVVNEAMIFENPAIVSDRVGCGPDLVDGEETGFMFSFGSTEAITDRIRWFTEHPERRLEMGKRARELVTTRHTVQNTVEGTVEASRAVLNRE